ncbi:MAG: response regulator [Spirochaetaceae bacterium]
MNTNKQQILIVDDINTNLQVLYNILKDDYEVLFAKNGIQALKIINNNSVKPDLILLDVMMPEMDGFEVCRKLKQSFFTKNIPIIFVSAKDEDVDEETGFGLGAVDYIAKPVRPAVVLARVKTHLLINDQKKHLEDIVKERTNELENTRLKIIRRLAKAGEFKDNETGMHVIRMSKYAQLLAKKIGMSDEESKLLLNVAPMHDIGKIGIPDHILLKKGPLDAEEWNIMKKHAQIGYDILGEADADIISEAKNCAITHHEKWDGSGYPNGIKGEDIPIYGRIVGVSDVFDALTSERPYKKAWSVEKALELLIQEKGKHFDPDLIDKFLEIIPEILKIKEEFKG